MPGRSAGLRRADAAPALVAVGLCLLIALTQSQLGDYSERHLTADNPAPAIRALLDGDLSRYADVQPLIGLTSLLLRLPFAAFAGDSVLWTYRLGSLACLLTAAVLAVAVDRRLRSQQAAPLVRVVVGGLLIANPFTLSALDSGHPEEIVGSALVVAAVLAALGGRAVAAGLLLGLAIGTKQWALVALGPVLVALPAARWRPALLAAAAAAAVMILPGFLASPERYREGAKVVADYHRVYPQSAWWPVSVSEPRIIDLGGETLRVEPHKLPLGLDRGVTSFLTLAIAIAASALLLVRRAPAAAALALLAFVMAVRAVLDPTDLPYYVTPWALAMLTWAALHRERLLLVVAGGAVLWLGFTTRVHVSSDLRFAIVAVATIALMAVLTTRFGPSRALATLASPEKGGGPYR